MKSVLELGRYQVGDVAWWVAIRDKEHAGPEYVSEDIFWMYECHPKILYTRGPNKNQWKKHQKLPKLHHSDFLNIITLLTSDLEVEPFTIANISRSPHTGEYYYGNMDDEWMPESNLSDTRIAATKERERIRNMLRRWVEEIGR